MNSTSENAHLSDGNSTQHSVVVGLWSNYSIVRRWLSVRIPRSFEREADADDVLQETFAEACRHAETLATQEDTAVRNWLALVARRKLIDRVRRANSKRRKAVDQRMVSPDQVEVPAAMATPSSFVARREAKELLGNAMSQLSKRHHDVVRLRFFESMSFSDIGEQMGISEEAAQMLSNRALRKLKALLGDRSRLLSG